MWRILEPGNLILLFPIRDAAPMSAAGFAVVAIEAAILNYIIGHAEHSSGEQHPSCMGCLQRHCCRNARLNDITSGPTR
jgi:hypothetical protein